MRDGAGNLAFRSSFSRLCDYFAYFCNLPPITLAIRGRIVDSNNIEANNTRQRKGKTMKTLYTECLGNGKLTQLEVIQDRDGTVRFMIECDGCYGQVFSGTIQEARLEYRKLKAQK